MTKEEFFEMNVCDEFVNSFGIFTGRYKVYDISRCSNDVTIRYKNIINGRKMYASLSDMHHKYTNLFVCHSKKIPNLSPVERVDKKIAELKAVLEKWEAEKKSLEIQHGKFYEIEYKIGCLSKIGVFYIEAIRHGGDVLYAKTTRTYEYLDKKDILSFKQITNISVLEQAWKNV